MATELTPVAPREYAHWGGKGYAQNFSRAVAEASVRVASAERALLATLMTEYPRLALVTVVHHRGSFLGEVVGWDPDGSRVAVRNLNSLKTSKWWAAHVELREPQNG